MCGATGIGRAASAGPSHTRLLHTPLTRLSHATYTPLTRLLVQEDRMWRFYLKISADALLVWSAGMLA